MGEEDLKMVEAGVSPFVSLFNENKNIIEIKFPMIIYYSV